MLWEGDLGTNRHHQNRHHQHHHQKMVLHLLICIGSCVDVEEGEGLSCHSRESCNLLCSRQGKNRIIAIAWGSTIIYRPDVELAVFGECCCNGVAGNDGKVGLLAHHFTIVKAFDDTSVHEPRAPVNTEETLTFCLAYHMLCKSMAAQPLLLPWFD